MRACLVGLVALLACAARAGMPVDVELVLAVDVSRSIDSLEFDLQRQGYAAAFRDRRVLDAVMAGRQGRIAVAFVEWSGAESQVLVVDWTLVDGPRSAEVLAARIEEAPRPFANWTSISGAIDFSMPLFARNEYDGERRIIDISGDGINNSGGPAEASRDRAVEAGFTINGLAILNDRPNPFPNNMPAPQVPVDKFFAESVIGGPGAFLMTARDFSDFQQAVIAKLVKEIAWLAD